MPEYPQRRNIRIKDYDYSLDNYYFVTICTYEGRPYIEEYYSKVEDILLQVVKECKGVSIDIHILMSNHVHVIFIFHDAEKTLGQVVQRIKALVTKNTIKPFWQRGYYEHVIRHDVALDKIREYIINNPLKKKIDFKQFYPRKNQDSKWKLS